MAAEMCLLQLPALLAGDGEAEFQPSPFFAEQLTAFELWLAHGSASKQPPEQLPIVLQVLTWLALCTLSTLGRPCSDLRKGCHICWSCLNFPTNQHCSYAGHVACQVCRQCSFDKKSDWTKDIPEGKSYVQVLLSQVHRLRALVLLGRFLDMGAWAVDLALSVGIFPYVLKLLQTTAADLRTTLVFIWTKILALDKSCQVMLLDCPCFTRKLHYLWHTCLLP